MLYQRRNNSLVTMLFVDKKITVDESHIWGRESIKEYEAPVFALTEKGSITKFIESEFKNGEYKPKGYLHYADSLYYHDSTVDAHVEDGKFVVKPINSDKHFTLGIEEFLTLYKEV